MKSIFELYAQTKPTSNARGVQDLALKMKPQVTPLQKSSGAREILFDTQGDFGNSSVYWIHNLPTTFLDGVYKTKLLY
jgi:hypothetical protein